MISENKILKILRLIPLALLLMACEKQSSNEEYNPPVIIESGDECHVCGMLIIKMPGPKGQAFDKRSQRTKKFCSTFDLISWYLQPENISNVAEIYVHDMANNSWETPDDAKLISAREAFFVVDSKKKGSMGKAIVSFENQSDAESFKKQWGGQIKPFEQLSLDLILN